MPIRDLSVHPTRVQSLNENPRNARTHSNDQIRQIARSIEVFGWVNPIIIDRSSMIIAGAGRLAAARLLGLDTVPAIRIEDMSEAQRRAYILADNKLADNAGWDDDLLKLELQELIEIERDFEITITGFEMGEIDMRLSQADEELDDGRDWQEPAGRALPAITKSGDLWHLGPHRLLCGDATQASDFDRLMSGEDAEIVFTDPPYNVSMRDVVGRGSRQHREFAMASGEMSSAEFVAFLETALGLAAAHSIDGAVHFVCMDWRHADDLQTAGSRVYDQQLNLCVWVKPNGGMGSLYRSQHELVFVFKSGTATHINNVELGRHGRNRTNVWNYVGMNSFGLGRDQALAAHPTVKPVALVKDAILDCSNRDGIVLDAFAGSGTTLIAAHRAGRRAYGLEIDPAYVDIALRRFRALTGTEPVHTDTGVTLMQLESEEQNAADVRPEPAEYTEITPDT
jgi:DNA modification methylase